MGMTVRAMRSVMTEAEFQSHRVMLAANPDPAEKCFYLLKLLVPLTMALANSWGGKFKLRQEHLDPWEEARTKAAMSPEDRINLWAETMMGKPSEK